MPDELRRDLIAFLRKKQCEPCRRGDRGPRHPGCEEAERLIGAVESL